jgi:hypothetical protein
MAQTNQYDLDRLERLGRRLQSLENVGTRAMWCAGIDQETCTRIDGAWTFRHKWSEPLLNVLFETGWASTRFP